MLAWRGEMALTLKADPLRVRQIHNAAGGGEHTVAVLGGWWRARVVVPQERSVLMTAGMGTGMDLAVATRCPLLLTAPYGSF